jgi:hypothetical protein
MNEARRLKHQPDLQELSKSHIFRAKGNNSSIVLSRHWQVAGDSPG